VRSGRAAGGAHGAVLGGAMLRRQLRPRVLPRGAPPRPTRATPRAMSAAPSFLRVSPYTPPPWAAHLSPLPSSRVSLAMTPTPVQGFRVPGLPDDVALFLKRDDLTGLELSGNKVRKLEFLLADALAAGCDCVVTIGGVQSNHARATAVAARLLGLDAHLILRTSAASVDADPGLVGNLLVGRLAGATLHMVSRAEYTRVGSAALVASLGARLRAAGRKPYLIPVGGSDALGTWGYLECMRELADSDDGDSFDHIALACGSGGTAAGTALGVRLSGLRARVTAFGVCDDPDYFYAHADKLFAAMGAGDSICARDCMRIVQARGAGYAESTEEEMDIIAATALATGVLLDPVYGGKALCGLVADIAASPKTYAGKRVLFLHTGGLFGAYDKDAQLSAALARHAPGRVQRFRPDEHAAQC
jgi:D-cysteine desulfhydrase family pyridoxal phosphate-dependent enzyme